MTVTGVARAPAGDARPAAADGPRGWSLYTQVVAVNTAILLGAAALLVLTPATVSFPVATEQGLLLGAGVTVTVVANAVLLRLSFQGLAGLVRRMENLDLLRTGERLPVRGGRETRALIAGYNTMLDGLENERRASTRRAVSTLEGERRRIGNELHDEVGQRLTGLLLQLQRARDEAPDHIEPRLARIQADVRATLDEVGMLAWQLRPGILDDLGLLRAMQALGDTLRAHATALVVLNLPARLPPLSAEVELALYRVAQEALTNAVRHAAASTITLTLSAGERLLDLEVLDDGCGLPAGTDEGAGLRGMRERALLISGRLDVASRPGHGVRVHLRVGDSRAPGEP
jgi:two-component system, NarL family, sensor histidine kinase UhpB